MNVTSIGPLNCHCIMLFVICLCSCLVWLEPETHILSSDIEKGEKSPDRKEEFILTSQ